jgi:CubicO group peptidase (beta-lactamase class C family)
MSYHNRQAPFDKAEDEKMTKVISRRKLLSGGIKAGVGFAVSKELNFTQHSALAFSEDRDEQAVRFQPALKRLDEFIARHMDELGLPGMTLVIADRKGLLRNSQYGFADLKAGVKVSPQNLFEIGSVSKSFVAIATLKLADEGKIDLHKPVTSYLPWLKVESRYAPFTTHHLLSHTSGLSGVPLLMRVAASTLRTGSEPGTHFVYSNIGYVLLGFLLEAADQRPFAEVLRKRVLEPLGMNSSEPVITNTSRERMAVGYGPLHDDRPFPVRGKLAEAPWLEVPEAAGSVAATPGDMAAYLQMLLNRGVGPRGLVLSEKSFDLFTKPVIKAPFRGEDASYAYGLWTSDARGHTLLRHTGGMVAFSSAMYADLTDGFAVFASVNARVGGYRPVAVTRYALDLLSAAWRNEELPGLPAPQPAPNAVKNAADFAGIFTSPEGKKLVLISQGEQLVLRHNNERIVLEQAGRDRFVVKHPDFELFLLNFGRDKDAVVEAFHGSNWWTNERYSGPKSFERPGDWEAFTGHYRSDSAWYGSTRVLFRKGRLTLDGEQPLAQIQSGVFQPEGEGNEAERIVFDTFVNGKTMRLNYSGIDFYRTLTP